MDTQIVIISSNIIELLKYSRQCGALTWHSTAMAMSLFFKNNKAEVAISFLPMQTVLLGRYSSGNILNMQTAPECSHLPGEKFITPYITYTYTLGCGGFSSKYTVPVFS